MKTAFGFSLIEVLLVVLVAGVIVVVIANIIPAMNLIGVSSNENTARTIVAKKIEDLRAQGYDNLGSDGSFSYTDPRLSSLAESTATVTIEPCPIDICLNNEPIKQVKIEVGWTEKGNHKSFGITTLIAQGGIK